MSNEAPGTNRPPLSRFNASILLYLIATVVIGLLVGTVLNGLNKLPPYVATIAGSLGAVIALLSGLLGTLLERSFPKGIWRNANRPVAIVASILTVGFLTVSALVISSPSRCPSLGPCPQETATAIAQTNATATAQVNTTATTQVNVPATATATARQNEYTTATSGIPVLDDPLSDNSKGYGWNVGSGECQFTGGALHAIRTTPGIINCDATGAGNFSNFAFQVQMTIMSGDAGGIDFRSGSGSGYFFSIGQNGSYTFYRSANFSLQTVANGSSTAIHKGLGQTNLITVIAKNNMFDFYVNAQYVTTVTDSTIGQGSVGVDANDINNSTEVAFNNAKAWML